MGDRTGIEWAANADGSPGASWNPIVGCAVHTPGCTHCYAMREAARAERMAAGAGRVSAYAGLTTATKAGPVWTGEQRLVESAIDTPLRWRRPRTIFAGSMSDWFADGVPDAWLDRLWTTMVRARRHTFILLTKRADRMQRYVSARAERTASELGGSSERWEPSPNVWLGVSAEDQTRANERVPLLLDTPAAVRLISCEPLLGAVDLTVVRDPDTEEEIDALSGHVWSTPTSRALGSKPRYLPTLHWVIAGGESGPGARPMHPDWTRALRDQCAAAATPFFFKQWGEWAPGAANTGPEDGLLARVGKRAAGRLLDGRTHDARPPFPAATPASEPAHA